MPEHSSGILAYRYHDSQLEVFLVHPGGPWWAGKDRAAWSIPKGKFDPQEEDAFLAAKREFREETGFEVDGAPVYLGQVRQSRSKVVQAWMVQGDFDPARIRSNTFFLEWPRGSGEYRSFPEIDRAAWFDLVTARQKLHKGQVPLLDLLLQRLQLGRQNGSRQK